MKLYLAIKKYLFTENDNGNVKNDIQGVGKFFVPKPKPNTQGNSVVKNNKKAMEELIKCKNANKLSTNICQQNFIASLRQG